MRFLIFIAFFILAQTCFGQVRQVVVKSHPNGKPEVIYHLKGKEMNAEKIKEEVFYENGKHEYIGQFKNGVEHGEWTYYYENGNIKAREFWKNGVEHGTWKEYHPDGQLAREIVYKDGEIVETIVKKRQ